MGSDRDKEKMGFRMMLIVVSLLFVSAFSQGALAAEVKQESFSSPDEAVKIMVDAARADDTKALLTIFGAAGKDIISSGDEVSDKREREWFIGLYEQKHSLAEEGNSKIILNVGNEDWPFPVPITKKGDRWVFNTQEGREEILNRRIGKNELATIQVCLAMVDAQREYALRDPDNDGLAEYAQRFLSTPGRKDGLYWQAKEGEEQSPLGPLAAKAVAEGYGKKPADRPVPYHGYFFRMLKAQGKDAQGGAYDYVVKGKMIGGFAIVAYPAEYENSGVMTFIVNQDGVVYQKNLGKETVKLAQAMTKFDPDKTWTKVE
jgi:hypothetical protein